MVSRAEQDEGQRGGDDRRAQTVASAAKPADSPRPGPAGETPAGCRSAACSRTSVKNSTHQPPASSMKPSSGLRRCAVVRVAREQKAQRTDTASRLAGSRPSSRTGHRTRSAANARTASGSGGRCAPRKSTRRTPACAGTGQRTRARPRPSTTAANASNAAPAQRCRPARQPAVQPERRHQQQAGRPAPWSARRARTPRPRAATSPSAGAARAAPRRRRGATA